MKKTIIALLAGFAAFTASAAQYELDTPDFHVIVTRPIDIWSGDQSASEKSLDALREKTATYTIWNQSGAHEFGNSSTLLFQNLTLDLAQSINAKLGEKGFQVTSSSANSGRISKATPIDPKLLPDFFAVEEYAYKRSVAANGDPETLQSRTSVKKFVGGALSLATIGLAANKFGAEGGAHFSLGSGLSDSVNKLTYQYKGPVIPVVFEQGKVDFSSFTEADIREVKTAQPDRVGQIIIAYKNGKTQQTEQAAIIEAMALLFAGSTPEQVAQNREADYKAKKDIWDGCVASGACK